MLLEALILSILVGLLRKGNLKNLDRIHLRGVYLFLVSMVIFGGVCAIALRGNPQMVHYARLANIVQYVGLLTAIALNLNIREMWLVGLGTFMNFLVLTANGGVMPMSKTALRAAGLTQLLDPKMASRMVRHAVMTPDMRLKWLADIIGVGPFSFLPTGLANVVREVASIGDVFVAIAIFILIQRYMCETPPKTKEIIA